MSRHTASLCLLAAFGLALTACSSSSDSGKLENPNLFPTDFRKEIVATLRTFFESNDTVRVTGALVSDPVLAQVDKAQRYTACVRYTAHSVRSGEIGNAVRIAFFYGGHLNQLIPAGEGQCVNAAYKPFPELNKFCIGVGCKS